eukprot:TRINITY_DN2259_c0_g1_i1.p3 TRINITY_DN2259_c0_g1~~TRINITY_DN2259_c0_g1_i1.p3  ORF type:complete len:102 (+),score=9.88 TRINITY_DN2259_c0_g1_i1:113-418(+)
MLGARCCPMCCNSACCMFWAGLSGFGVFYMFLLGALIQTGYPFVGIWYNGEDTDHGVPTEDAKNSARSIFFGAAGINAAIFIITLLLTFIFARMERKSKLN